MKIKNTDRLSFKSKLEKPVSARKCLTELETKYKQHPSLNCFNLNFNFLSHGCSVAIGNFKNLKIHLRLDMNKTSRNIQLKGESLFLI